MPSPIGQSPPPLLCRPLRADEVDEACALARTVFDRCVAPDQPEEGRRMFHAFAQPAALLRRHRKRYATWVAVAGPEIVGVLHIHAANHLSLLFVAPEHHGRGCARALLRAAAEAHALVPPLTVNASPGSVSFYARLGFAATGPARFKDGVHHQPMRGERPLF